MTHRAASKVVSRGHQVRVEELVEGVNPGVYRLAVDQWDRGIFKAIDELID